MDRQEERTKRHADMIKAIDVVLDAVAERLTPQRGKDRPARAALIKFIHDLDDRENGDGKYAT